MNEDEWLFQFLNFYLLIQGDKYLEKGSVRHYILDLLLIRKYIDYIYSLYVSIYFSEYCNL